MSLKVWVDKYYKADGTLVKGHWRSVQSTDFKTPESFLVQGEMNGVQSEIRAVVFKGAKNTHFRVAVMNRKKDPSTGDVIRRKMASRDILLSEFPDFVKDLKKRFGKK
jgi:hypothetical protein